MISNNGIIKVTKLDKGSEAEQGEQCEDHSRMRHPEKELGQIERTTTLERLFPATWWHVR